VKISVVTVTLNSAATLVATLRSVATQTHADVEHIIIDGDSVDETLALVRRNCRPGARVLSERDLGIYDAMNKGLRLASGDIVGFLNADDVYQNERVLADVAAAAADPAVQAVYGDLVYVNKEQPGKVVRYWRSGASSARGLKYGWMPPHPTLYVRRALLEQLGGFDASLRIAADYDFMLRLLRQPGIRLAYVNRVLVRMRLGGASNRSLQLIYRKSREDLLAVRRNGVGGWFTVFCKNFRKLPQFVRNRSKLDCT